MRSLLIALPILAIAAPVAAAPAAPYRALGTEPFWNLTIDQRTMRLEEMGKRPVTVRAPRARPSFNGERYVARGVVVDVTHKRCSDGMSDRQYRDTVTVTVGRRTLRGCGGATIGGQNAGRPSLANTRWTVWQVNGRELRPERPLTVNFTVDRVEGKLCNSFGGSYRMVGDRLDVGRVMSTRMACQGPAQVAESALFALWAQPAKATTSRWGTLTLSRGRDTVTLRPAR